MGLALAPEHRRGHGALDRSFRHTYGRGKNEPLLDAIRLEPGTDVTAVAVQVPDVVERLMPAGQWKAGDLDILLLDAGYDVQRLSFLWSCWAGCVLTE